MTIPNINPVYIGLQEIPEPLIKNVERKQNIFSDVLDKAVDLIKDTNRFQIERDIAQTKFATGEDDNMLTVLLAQEKAYTSLNFTVQVTNKIIESYREIMRMQM